MSLIINNYYKLALGKKQLFCFGILDWTGSFVDKQTYLSDVLQKMSTWFRWAKNYCVLCINRHYRCFSSECYFVFINPVCHPLIKNLCFKLGLVKIPCFSWQVHVDPVQFSLLASEREFIFRAVTSQTRGGLYWISSSPFRVIGFDLATYE